MKDQYLVGLPQKDFVRITDMREMIGFSLSLDDAIDAQKIVKKSKIYKLVEVKK
ncbi:hypothetical protein LCGC14_2450260 [marine sediment metagenome]|uniref:Uncharacterized protein n=1 Tax=marine sediment metagenome TaxID=412755 RepID=A0A0F9C400_9ZZZZ